MRGVLVWEYVVRSVEDLGLWRLFCEEQKVCVNMETLCYKHWAFLSTKASTCLGCLGIKESTPKCCCMCIAYCACFLLALI